MDEPSTRTLSRRGLLSRAGTAAAGSVTLAGATGLTATAHAAARSAAPTPAHQPPPPTLGPVRITPDDVVHGVTEAVRAGKRVAVRSGGHCFENFTADPAIEVLLDMSPMNAVGYDPAVQGPGRHPPGRRLPGRRRRRPLHRRRGRQLRRRDPLLVPLAFHIVVQADGGLPNVEGMVDELFKALSIELPA